MRLLPGAVLSASLLLLFACAGSSGVGPGAAGDPGATPAAPMASIGPQVAAAAATLETRLAEAGFRLQPSLVEYRPGEPALVQQAPRAVYRVALADPSEGWVLVYGLGSADVAQQAGQQFADYLAGGLGQTNYPRDAQFVLSRVDTALVFFWWSRERSSEPERAQAVFEVVGGVGQAIEIRP